MPAHTTPTETTPTGATPTETVPTDAAPDDGVRTEAVDTAWLDRQIGYRLRRASAAMAADYAAHAGDDRLRPVLVSMLSVIVANPGIGQTELGRALGVQRANMVPLVADLVARGLVDRRRSARDGRRLELHATPAGRTAFDSGRMAIESHEARMTAAMTARERSVLLDLLRRID